MNKKILLHLLQAVIFFWGIIFQLGLQKAMRPYAINGYLFQNWSSEALMQTVSIEDLRDSPFETLNNIHIQPPGLDMLRAIFAQFWRSTDIQGVLRHVDESLYLVWTIIYGMCSVLIFTFLEEKTDFLFAFIAAVLFFFHPALIFYATHLDTTLLSSFLVLWMYFLLWKQRDINASVVPLACSAILLFFFRSLFQLPFIFVLAASLFFLKISFKKIALFMAITLTVCGLYVFKQKLQFNLAGTSSFTGINLVRSVGIKDYEFPYAIDLQNEALARLPNVLTRAQKISGEINYNHVNYLEFNRLLTNEYKKYILETPVRKLIRSYKRNLTIYFNPSSKYTDHVIVDRLFWRDSLDVVFSAPVMPVWLGIAGVFYMLQRIENRNINEAVAFLLPTLYIFSTSVLFEKGENNRFKFFLEPMFYVFVLSQGRVAYLRVCSFLATHLLVLKKDDRSEN
jgi:hypothetical protein